VAVLRALVREWFVALLLLLLLLFVWLSALSLVWSLWLVSTTLASPPG
jgi:hypothetical protein